MQRQCLVCFVCICNRGNRALYCIQCSKEKRRERDRTRTQTESYRERHRKRQSNWRSRNIDKAKAREKRAREKRRSVPSLIEKDRLRSRIWRQKESSKAYMRSYRKKQRMENPQYSAMELRRARARRMRLVYCLTSRQDGKCLGCKRLFSEKLKATIDHVFPVSRGGGNELSNMSALCGSCNPSKGSKTFSEWENNGGPDGVSQRWYSVVHQIAP